uniref:C2H2-type domain-containing protein n=1 Tax=Scophthalmus maximus TaxID=52904 RepID=A0A8D2ZVF7_SCOMX
MLDFLSRLEKLLPVPDIQQTASMLCAVPSALEECVHSVPDLQHLKTVLLYNTTLGHFDFSEEAQSIPSSFGNCILSSLSLPQLEKVIIDTDQIQLQPSSEQMQGCMAVQVEGETVTLLDYIQIEQPEGLVEPDDQEVTEMNEEEAAGDATDEDVGDALKPAAFQPLKQSKRLQLKRKALKDKNSAAAKRQRKKYPNNKTCPVCSKTFLRAAAMRRHQEIHSSNRDLRYKCAHCDKRFRDLYDMNRHNMRVHEKDELSSNSKEEDSGDPCTSEMPENKTCDLCGKYFGRPVDMERHMKSHSEDRPYRCPFCEKKFKNPYVLKRHQKEICKSRELKRLKRKETQQSNPLLPPPSDGSTEGKVCPICSRVLPCTADIAKHLRSHSEERPFICVTCEKGFKYKDTLKKHQIIHGHEGIREEESKTVEQILAEADTQTCDDATGLDKGGSPEESPSAPVHKVGKKGLKVCPVCSRAFDSVKTLNRHVQCHTEDRPYHCVHCKKRFKHMHGLKRHQIYAICHKKITRFLWKKEPRAGSSQGEPTGADPQQGPPLKIPVWCSNCGKHFEYPSALKEHQENVCQVDVRERHGLRRLRQGVQEHDHAQGAPADPRPALLQGVRQDPRQRAGVRAAQADAPADAVHHVRQDVHAAAAPARALREAARLRRAVRLPAVRQDLRPAVLPRHPPEDPQGRVPVQVQPVSGEVPLVQLPDGPPAEAHGREALPVLAVRQVLPLGVGAHRAHGHALG